MYYVSNDGLSMNQRLSIPWSKYIWEPSILLEVEGTSRIPCPWPLPSLLDAHRTDVGIMMIVRSPSLSCVIDTIFGPFTEEIIPILIHAPLAYHLRLNSHFSLSRSCWTICKTICWTLIKMPPARYYGRFILKLFPVWIGRETNWPDFVCELDRFVQFQYSYVGPTLGFFASPITFTGSEGTTALRRRGFTNKEEISRHLI